MSQYYQEFLKKKVSGEIAFDLISLFHVQIQEPKRSSNTTRAFVFLQNFIITKYLKHELDDDLNICMDERSPCDLSVTVDIKIYQCHVIKMMLLPPVEKCPIVYYHRVVLTA